MEREAAFHPVEERRCRPSVARVLPDPTWMPCVEHRSRHCLVLHTQELACGRVSAQPSARHYMGDHLTAMPYGAFAMGQSQAAMDSGGRE